MQDAESAFFLSGIDRYVGARTKGHGKWKGDLFRALEGSENLISFRNKYAHGATPPDEESMADFEKYEMVFRNLVRAVHFKQARLVAIEEDGSGLVPPPMDRFESAAVKDSAGKGECGEVLPAEGRRRMPQSASLALCRRDNPASGYGFFFITTLGTGMPICWNTTVAGAGVTRTCVRTCSELSHRPLEGLHRFRNSGDD